MNTPTAVRLGIIGMGNMGTNHARNVQQGAAGKHLQLSAIGDLNAERLKGFDGVAAFTDPLELIASGTVDAVLIATPHFSHTDLGIAALEAGLHVLVEKPISVHKADAARLIAAHQREDKVFAAMFNQRTDPLYQKVRQLIRNGELGQLYRVSWIITDWYRTHFYYNSGGWRATWAGEGGGVLLNQCPHQLDLWQWLFGMPQAVQATCALGKYHMIEVEDDVTALLKYADGLTGTFITSTGEAPGTNRLEIASERGRLIVEDQRIRWNRTEVPVPEHCQSATKGFAKPDLWQVEVPVLNPGGRQHVAILENFAATIRAEAALIAPAREGIHSVELGNAILYAGLTGETVQLPLDAAQYQAFLEKKMADSTFKKPSAAPSAPASDFDQSF